MITHCNLFCKICLILSILSALATIYLVYDYRGDRSKIIREAKIYSSREIQKAAAYINQKFKKTQDTVDQLAIELSENNYPKEIVLSKVKKAFNTNSVFLSVVVAYEPEGKNIDAPGYINSKDRLSPINFAKFNDHTEFINEWYYRPIASDRGWTNPRYSNILKTTVVDYGAAFYEDIAGKKRIKGVISVSLSFENIKNVINAIDVGNKGYAYLFSKNGKIFYHPDEEIVLRQQSVFDIAAAENNKSLWDCAQAALEGKSDTLDIKDKKAKEELYLFLYPIKTTSWCLVVANLKQATFSDQDTIRQKCMQIIISAMLLILFVLCSYSFYKDLNKHSLIIVSSLVSIAFIIGIIISWSLTISYPGDNQPKNKDNPQNIKILGRSSLNKFKNIRKADAQKIYIEEPVFIPTGLFIQSIEFKSSNEVFVTGYIWQKYDKLKHKDISKGFVFPEAISHSFNQIYEIKNEKGTKIAWYFETSFRESFYYEKYPFDTENVWLRIWHKDFDKNVILTPDIDSYKQITPISLPGIEDDIVLGSWEIIESYFDYKFNSYNTNFGIDNYIGQNNFPELYFNVILKRSFLGLFVANFIPIVAVAVITFIALLLTKKETDILSLTATYTGLIFIVILAQIDLRRVIDFSDILYFENFYFILYIIISMMIINSYFYITSSTTTLLHYRDNFISKILYWPMITAIIYIVTFKAFY